MPIYEFYCKDCHRVFNFLSNRINTDKKPVCPRCGKVKLERQVSMFYTSFGAGKEEAGGNIPDIDESRLEKAMTAMASEVENIDESDPRQAANLMRKLTDMTGLNLGGGMEEALSRMEAGEDPEQIEAEMGDILGAEEPFLTSAGNSVRGKKTRRLEYDKELYSL